MYDLELSQFNVDERSDTINSTQGRKLLTLIKTPTAFLMIGFLALAAYNSGPGNVNKAIRRSGGYKNYLEY